MFFRGTLKEGLAFAVQHAQSVVCFVTDGGDVSKLWEDEYLADESLKPLLAEQAVTLRLVDGSAEASYLAQLYPLPKKPTVVVISQGQMKEYISAGVSKQELIQRIRNILTASNRPGLAASQQQSGPSASPSSSSSPPPPPVSSSPTPAPVPSATTPSSTAATVPTTQQAQQQQRQQEVRDVFATHRARLEAERQRQAEEEKRQRAERAKQDAADPARAEQVKHAEALRKKRREANEERERILKAIQDDKAARKARQAEREVERNMTAAAGTTHMPFGGEEPRDVSSSDASSFPKPAAPSSSSSSLPPSAANPPASSRADLCSLQVRLADGSTIRNRFSASAATLGADVRAWVDRELAKAERGKKRAKQAYAFKLLLAPMPSRAVDASEEDQPLRDIGLAPSSTLILVPAGSKNKASGTGGKDGAAARAGPDLAGRQGQGRDEDARARTNRFSRLLAWLVALVFSFVANVVLFFSTILGGRPAGGPQAPVQVQGRAQGGSRSEGTDSATAATRVSGWDGPRTAAAAAAARRFGTAPSSRIKGFEDAEEERRPHEKQFYNGNSTNFEPRHDEDDEASG